jgi:hypothetical protein
MSGLWIDHWVHLSLSSMRSRGHLLESSAPTPRLNLCAATLFFLEASPLQT